MPFVVLAALFMGAACGFLNGWVITRFHLNDFITTLASGFVFSGFGLAALLKDSKGAIVSQAIKNQGFLALGRHVGGFYYITIAWVIMYIICLL